MMMGQQVDTPFDPLLDIADRVRYRLPTSGADVSNRRRQVAAKWLAELFAAISDFHDRLIKILRVHPALKGSTDADEYKTFFKKLAEVNERLYHRDVKGDLSANLRKLKARFEVDFIWLKEEDSDAYTWLERAVASAYDNEHGILEHTSNLIRQLTEWDAPADGDATSSAPIAEKAENPKFIKQQIRKRGSSAALIRAYASRAMSAVSQLRFISEDADIRFVPVEAIDQRNQELLNQEAIRVQKDQNEALSGLAYALRTTPQQQHQRLYTLLSFAFGGLFLLLLIGLAVAIPNPTPYQTRVFLTVQALACAGAATTISGLLSASISLGKQLTIGATGALAVFVITYFQNPAILG